MNQNILPQGTPRPAVAFPYFPTRQQAFLWRNWGLVPVERLAQVLQTQPEQLELAAEELGLPPYPACHPRWMSRGYLTLIRNNWHLLDYPQLLELLNWTPEHLARVLNEEDFFWYKLGLFKPVCETLHFRALTHEERAQTRHFRETVERCFPGGMKKPDDPPFAFSDRWETTAAATGGETPFEFSYIHSYAAGCGDVIGSADSENPVPESLLKAYEASGIRGIWMHALLRFFLPIPGAERFSPEPEKHLDNLRKIVSDCAKHGIKVYLYLNEPRSLPEEFFALKPEWSGIPLPELHTRTICTTRTGEPLQWLHDAMRHLFAEVPGLGGAFCITMSENPTNCHYRTHREDCPFCRERLPETIIADILIAMERGMHEAAPEAKMIAFDWAWSRHAEDTDRAEFKHAVIDRLPRNIYLASVSEWGMRTHVGGVEQYLQDYSISQVGPSPETLDTWRYARAAGLKIAAKIQVNNSWELSAVPYIPVPYLVREHLDKLRAAGVDGVMLSWTLGGFPGGNLPLLQQTPEELAAARFQADTARLVCRAWRQFSDAFREFPFHLDVIYNSPVNYGPKNPLSRQPTGFKATMIGFPYDDLASWRGPYPEAVFERQFELLTENWRRGLELLKLADEQVLPAERADFEELRRIAEAAYCHFRSTWCQIHFIRLRDDGAAPSRLAEPVREEQALAARLLQLSGEDSRIGFEASNHYYYTANDLREKVLNCALLLESLEKESRQ